MNEFDKRKECPEGKYDKYSERYPEGQKMDRANELVQRDIGEENAGKTLSYGAGGLILGIRRKGNIFYAFGEHAGEKIGTDPHPEP